MPGSIKNVPKYFSVYIPASFDADEIIDPLKIRKDAKERLKQGIQLFVSILLNKTFQKDDLNEFLNNGSIRLKREILAEKLGSQTQVSKILKVLVSEGVVIVDKSYQTGA